MLQSSSRAQTHASVRPAVAGLPAAPLKVSRRASRHVVRAESEQQPGSQKRPEQGSGTIFYGGNTYTEEQWKDAVARNEFAQAPSTPQTSSSTAPPTIQEVMGFSGAPEIINGRLAMLGFVAALGAELASGDSVLKQLTEEPTLISLTFITFAAASLVPAFARRKGDTLGPFTPQAEMTNGRAAMIGFAAMLVLESIRGVPLF